MYAESITEVACYSHRLHRLQTDDGWRLAVDGGPWTVSASKPQDTGYKHLLSHPDSFDEIERRGISNVSMARIDR